MLLLSACGGGGGGTSPSVQTPVAVQTFPLALATASLVNDKKSSPFTITGTAVGSGQSLVITGSGTTSESTSAGAFEGVSALLKTLSATGSLTVQNGTQGTTVPFASTSSLFFDSNYRPLGSVSANSYCVWASSTPLPAVGRIGDTAVWYSGSCYADSSKAALVETRSVSYVLEPGTGSSAQLKLISSFTNSQGATTTQSETYSVSTTGVVNRVEIPMSFVASGMVYSLLLKYL